MTERPVHLGIIGLGGWSRQIFQAADEIPGTLIVGCHSRHSDTRKAFASQYGCRPYETYQQMTEDPEIEGIIVMSSNLAHEGDVSLAASRGKHVFVTKPITTTLDAARRVIRLCAERNVILAVGHQTRREPALRRLKDLVDSGDLGDIRLVEANYSTPNGLKIVRGDWRWSETECPGGALVQIGIHVIDTLHYLFGRIGRVFSWQEQGGLEAEIAGVTATLLEFDSGLKGYLGSSYVSSFSHWIRVYGGRRNAFFEELHGLTLTDDSWERGEVQERIAPPAKVSAPMPAVVEELAEFARCIRTGGKPEIGGEKALLNLAVVLAAVESARRGKPIQVKSLLEE